MADGHNELTDNASADGWVSATEGTQYVLVSGDAGTYGITINESGVQLADDHGNTWATATQLEFGRFVHGSIEAVGDRDMFVFDAGPGIVLDAAFRTPFDTEVFFPVGPRALKTFRYGTPMAISIRGTTATGYCSHRDATTSKSSAPMSRTTRFCSAPRPMIFPARTPVSSPTNRRYSRSRLPIQSSAASTFRETLTGFRSPPLKASPIESRFPT